MQTRKRFEKSKVIISGNVPTMLKRAKTVLSDRQYRKLCIAINEAADYNEKKGLIKACIQGKKIRFKAVCRERKNILSDGFFYSRKTAERGKNE